MMQEEINERILELWEKYDQFMRDNRPKKVEEPWPRWPLLYSNSFEKNPETLFIGLNPSFKKSKQKKKIEDIVELDDIDLNPSVNVWKWESKSEKIRQGRVPLHFFFESGFYFQLNRLFFIL